MNRHLWFDALASFLFPEVCQLCEEEPAGPDNGYVGARCRACCRSVAPPFCERCGLPFEGALTTSFACSNCRGRRLSFSRARAAVLAEGPVRDLIHFFKYRDGLWAEPFLAGLLVKAAGPDLAGKGDWLVVPVPLHRDRLRDREYNQAERLGRRLAREMGLESEPGALLRVLPTETQTHLTRARRLANMRRAFRAGPGAERVRGRRVVLVDDVLTTGATASACARELRRAGAREVVVWTVARGVHPPPRG